MRESKAFLAVRLSGPTKHGQTFLFGWSHATRTRDRRHEGCILGCRHQHLQAQLALADRLLRRRGVSRRQRSCRERDDDHHRGPKSSRIVSISWSAVPASSPDRHFAQSRPTRFATILPRCRKAVKSEGLRKYAFAPNSCARTRSRGASEDVITTTGTSAHWG
jgi:hypothetical protein